MMNGEEDDDKERLCGQRGWAKAKYTDNFAFVWSQTKAKFFQSSRTFKFRTYVHTPRYLPTEHVLEHADLCVIVKRETALFWYLFLMCVCDVLDGLSNGFETSASRSQNKT